MQKTIAHITDIHLHEALSKVPGIDQEANWKAVLKDLANHPVDEVVFGGDIGAASAHPYFFESLGQYPLTISLGNHDSYEEIKPTLTTNQGEDGHYYYFEDDHYRYIILDSSREIVSEKQFQWLTEALSTRLKVLIFVHHPILAVPSYIDSKHALRGREKLRQLLSDTGLAVTVVCGHYHMEDDRTEGNIRQLITPAASYQVAKSHELQLDATVFGYRLLHISPEKIDTDVIMLKQE